MQISTFSLAVAGVVTAASFSLAGAGAAYAFQPHMINAREHPNQALFELQTADPDKVDTAISRLTWSTGRSTKSTRASSSPTCTPVPS